MDSNRTARTLGSTFQYAPAAPSGRSEDGFTGVVDLLRMRTREGMAVARAKGRLRGKQPKLSARQQAHLVQLHQDGQHTIAELAELFSVSRPTVYRVLERARGTSLSASAATYR